MNFGIRPRAFWYERNPKPRAFWNTNLYLDQEVLARYLKNLDDEQRQITPTKEPEHTQVELNPTSTGQPPRPGIDQERLREALNRAARDKDEPDKDLDFDRTKDR